MTLGEEAGIGPQDEVRRDRYGRPLLIPRDPEGSLAPPAADGRVPYTRASGLADYASGTKTGLETWKRRLAARGVAEREDLAGMIAALPPLGEGKEYAQANKATNALLDEYVESALEHAGAHHKANYGTAIHAFTVQNAGLFPPERMQADIAAYEAELERLEITPLADEIFVANDGLWAAGTFDHLYRLKDGRVVVGDKKSGIPHLVDTAVQLSVYSSADFYDVATDERMTMEEFVAENFGGPYDPSVGLHVSIPAQQGTCKITMLDLDEGYQLAMRAAFCRTARLASSEARFIVPLEEAAESKPDEDYKASIQKLMTRFDVEQFVNALPEPVRSDKDVLKLCTERWKMLPA